MQEVAMMQLDKTNRTTFFKTMLIRIFKE